MSDIREVYSAQSPTKAEYLAGLKLKAANALTCLSNNCQRERDNILRFEDARCLVATYDIKRFCEYAIEAADALEDAFNELTSFGSEDEERAQ